MKVTVSAPLKSPANSLWRRGSTGVDRYGCILRSAKNNLGEIPQKWEFQIPKFKEFFWGANTLGLVPSSHPHSGIRLYFVRPHFLSPKVCEPHPGPRSIVNLASFSERTDKSTMEGGSLWTGPRARCEAATSVGWWGGATWLKSHYM